METMEMIRNLLKKKIHIRVGRKTLVASSQKYLKFGTNIIEMKKLKKKKEKSIGKPRKT